jgi:RecB family exonuclease
VSEPVRNPAILALARALSPEAFEKKLPADEDDLPDVPAVENGVINYLSVSQLKKAAECERKWFFTKVLHLEEPQRGSQELGKKVHKQLEHYLKTGEDVLGDIARAALPFLPKPCGPELLLEQSITASNRPITGPTVTADGIPLVGFIDRVEEIGTGKVPAARAADYKTSKDPEKWAATPEQLSTTAEQPGIQMVGYAVSVEKQLGLRHDDVIELEHLYLHTKPTKADKAAKRDVKQVLGSITPAKAHEEWKRMDVLAHRLREVARAKSLDDVRPSWNACKNFGGCAFQAQCLIHQTKAKEKTMGVADRILNRGTQAGAPPKLAVVEVILFGSIKVRDCVLGTTYQLNQKGLCGEFTGTSKDVGFFQTTEGVQKLGIDSAVEPVKMPPNPEPPPAAPAIAQSKPEESQPVATIVPSDAPKSDPAKAAEQPAASAEEKSKRGRSKSKGAPTDEHVEFTPLRIFVDSVPNCDATPLAAYVAKQVADIEKTFDVIDIRCAPSKRADGTENPIAFGKWKGALAGAIKADPPPAGTYLALGTSASEIMQVAVEALESMCGPGCFVRGVR